MTARVSRNSLSRNDHHTHTIMEKDVLDALNDIGYDGPILEEGVLVRALDDGLKSLEYTSLVAHLANELTILCELDEHVNAITTLDDSSSFLLELSSFLKELGCQYKCLTEGHLSERFNSRHNRAILLDYLLAELQSARMIKVNKPRKESGLKVHVIESSTASDLKAILMALKFPKPPVQITAATMFEKVEKKLKEVLCSAPKELTGTPLFTGMLSSSQWQTLGELQTELQNEYRIRRQMLIKRLDVTIQSFQWSERVRNQADAVTSAFHDRRLAMSTEPAVQVSDLLAARDDLAIIEKTSSVAVRKNTRSAVNAVIIGSVPDRGGRPSEQQAPPPEMPSWVKERTQGDSRGGGGWRGNSRGNDRPKNSGVQGGWKQGQESQGSWNQGQGGWGQGRADHNGSRGGRGGGRGGNRGGYRQ